MQAQAFLPRSGVPRHLPFLAFPAWFVVSFLFAVLIAFPLPSSAQQVFPSIGLQPVPLLEAPSPEALPLSTPVPASVWPSLAATEASQVPAVPVQSRIPRWPAPKAGAESIFKQVLFDPTTYSPAVLAFASMRLDWDSSQPFFRNGYHEVNGRYTVNGVSGGPPLGYAAGNRKIAVDALWVLGMSAANNGGERLFERFLASRLPDHPTLVRALGWGERLAFASVMSYAMSAAHFRQWQANEQLAQQLGYK